MTNSETFSGKPKKAKTKRSDRIKISMEKILNNLRNLIMACLSAAVCSCSNTRLLNEGEMLYTGAEIKIENDTLPRKQKKELESGLEENLTPKPNSSFLGLRPKLYIYNITKEPEKDKGLRHWLKYRVGEKPVLLQDVDREFNREIIVNHSENKGFFNATTTYDTVSKNKKAEVIYTVRPGARYSIANVEFEKDTTRISREILKLSDETLLKSEDYFDLGTIKAERERIDRGLKEKGFYFFSPDNIIVQADSTVSKNRKVDLHVKLKDDTPGLATEQFTIDK